jgi:RNA polymerase sigma factor (sigma-70 family)
MCADKPWATQVLCPYIHPEDSTPVEMLGLTARAYHHVRWAGTRTIGELAALDERVLMGRHGFGVGSLSSIKEALAKYAATPRTGHGPGPESVPWPEIDRDDPTPISKLRLRVGADNALKRAGVWTVGQLATLDEAALMNVWKIGDRALSDIKQALGRYAATLPTGDGPDAKTISEAYEVVIAGLGEREKHVLARRWGIEDGHKRTLQDLGKELGLTRERVRQIQKKALKKVHHWRKAHRPLAPVLATIEAMASSTQVPTMEDELISSLGEQGTAITPTDLRIVRFFVELGWVEIPEGVDLDPGAVVGSV